VVVVPHHREDGPELDGDLEGLGDLAAETQEIGGDDQVARARDGQELGRASTRPRIKALSSMAMSKLTTPGRRPRRQSLPAGLVSGYPAAVHAGVRGWKGEARGR